MKYRVAQLLDLERVLPDLLPLFREAHEEIYPGQPYAPDFDLVRHYWDTGALRVFVVLHGEAIVGFATGYIIDDPFSGRRVASEGVAYVRPEHRGKSVSYGLMRLVLTTLGTEAVDELTLTVAPERGLDDFLKRAGFRASGTEYKLELAKHGQ